MSMAAKEAHKERGSGRDNGERPPRGEGFGNIIEGMERMQARRQSLDTFLWAAIINRNADNVGRLIKLGADPNSRDSYGTSMLMVAAEIGDDEIVGLLLDEGANPDAKNMRGWSALHYAVEGGHLNALETLIICKADVDIRNTFGETGLMRAVHKGRLDVVKMLIGYGADVNAVNKKGLTALDYIGEKHPEIRRFLLENGAKPGVELVA